MENTLLKIWRKYERVLRWPGTPDQEELLAAYREKERARTTISWAVPDQGAIDLLVLHSPIIEIGAGNGFWAALVAQAGGEIVCFDAQPYENSWMNAGEKYYEVKKAKAGIAKNYSRHSLFLCWPPYDTPMAVTALRAYQGNTLIFVGEMSGGCTGDNAFFELLAAKWDLIDQHSIPQWPYIHDEMRIYKRC